MLDRTRGYILAVFVALVPAGTVAAPLGEADAVRIGREANVEGLRALIAQGDQGLLHRATGSWSFGTSRELPPALEALIVEKYADRTAQRALLALIARSLDNFERYPKYRSRKLFELLYADLKANTSQDRLHYSIRIIATDLKDVEPELVALLPVVDPASAQELVMFLGARRYAPAVPALQALQARIPLERNTNQMLERVDWAFLQIGTTQAIQALLGRMRSLAQSTDARAGSEVWNVLLAVNRLPPGSPPDYAELRAALPAQLTESSWSALIQLIASRKEKRGIPELLRAIAQSPKADEAVEALLAIGEPADWRAGRAELERAAGRLPPERAAALQKQLDQALADPAQFAARQEQKARVQGEERAARQFGDEKGRLAALKDSEPKRYAAELRALLERQPLRPQLGREYMELGAFLRFRLRQTDEAIAAYEAARRLQPAEQFDLAALSIADTLRFDKRDAHKAVGEYRRALESLQRVPQREARMAPGLKQWLGHEIAYLEHGRRFSGALGRADLEAGQLWLMLASMQNLIYPPPEPGALARLPASQFQLARTFPAMLELPPGEMLPFFARHDPAGYLTAAILALAVYKEPSPYVKAAAETFFRSRGIRGGPFSSAHPRYASPEKTWTAFLAAAKKADAGAMLECFTPDMQEKLQELFKRMSRDELRRMGESFVGFSMQSASEAAVVRQQQDRKVAGFVTFVNDGGAWKIAAM